MDSRRGGSAVLYAGSNRPQDRHRNSQADVGFVNESELCSAFRQVVNRLDALTNALKVSPVLNALSGMAPSFKNLERYLRLSLASMPEQHQTITVVSTATRVIANSSNDDMAVMVTNDDVANDLRYGASTIDGIRGVVLKREESVKLIVPPSTEVYALFPLATGTVTVSKLILPR